MRGGEEAEFGEFEEEVDWWRQRPEAIAEFASEGVEARLVGELGELAVDLNALGRFADVVERQEGGFAGGGAVGFLGSFLAAPSRPGG